MSRFRFTGEVRCYHCASIEANDEGQQLVRIWQRILQRLLLALYARRLTVVLAVVLVLAGTTYLVWRNNLAGEAAAAGDFPIEVTMQVQPQGSSLNVTLKEKNGSRSIAMNVAGTEAVVIARERGLRVQGELPQAYDLMRDVIQQLGGRVDRVVVNDANQTQYFAQIVVSTGSDTRVIRARPADALALALKSGAPIFVEDRILEQFGSKGSS